MKKIWILTVIAASVFSSCKVSELASYSDDVYANPAEEKQRARLAAEELAKQKAQEEQERQAALAEQKAKDDANPYYKDPEYSSEDYYDYEYASRVNRFQNPIYGAGYYDPYYTNMYTYNQNPACFGTSIYSTYNYGMPSHQFNNYSMGISTGWGYNNGFNNFGCSPFMGYNSGFNSINNDPFYGGGMGYYGYNNMGYNNWGYNNWGFYNGYSMGYSNGFNNAQWGYYNSLDPNSAYSQVQYSPRTSNGGDNSRTRTGTGNQSRNESSRESYFKSVAEQQNNAERFTNTTPRTRINSYPSNSGTSGNGTAPASNDRVRTRGGNQAVNTQNQGTNTGRSDRIINRRATSGENSSNTNNSQNRTNNTNSNSGWNNTNSGSSGSGTRSGGGSSTPRSSGGGNTRPR